MAKTVKKVVPKKVKTEKVEKNIDPIVEPTVELLVEVENIEEPSIEVPVMEELIVKEEVSNDLATANVPLSQNATNLLGWLKMYKMTAKQYAEKLMKTHPKKLEEGIFGASMKELLDKGL